MEAPAVSILRPARWLGVVPRLGALAQVSAVVLVSFIVRALASIGTQMPAYFPDEYIYRELGQSIAHSGRLVIRGGDVSFPAVLQPLLAAPLWGLASTRTAYELIQVENALFVALAAVPAYLLARRLRLSKGYALVCAVFAVAVPDGAFAHYVLTDPLAYPFVLASLYMGVVCLERPTWRLQLAFVALAGLATAARVQYATLFVAFAIAAIALERRRALRAYRVVFAAIGACAVGGLALGPARVLGFYAGVLHLHVGASALRWAAVDLFLLALVSGVVLVPGAVGALLRPATRTEASFAVLAAAFGGVILLVAALWASSGSDRFQERYLFTLLPLVPIAYGLRLQRGRTSRLAELLVAAALLAALARLPLSRYATATGLTDSPFLAAMWKLSGRFDATTVSLAVLVAGSLAAILGALPGSRRSGHAKIAVALALVLAVSTGANLFFAANTRALRGQLLPANPAWVDARHLGDVVAIETVGAPRQRLLEQLFWNQSVSRELLLGGGEPTDLFASAPVTVADDGTLHTGSEIVRSPILFEGYAVSARFDGAVLVARAKTFDLFRPTTTPRIRVLAVGRYWDGWLAWQGEIIVWPDASGYTRGTLAFTLSLPREARPVHLRIGRRRFRILPGERLPVRWQLQGRGPQALSFGALGGGLASHGLRPVSVRSTMPVFRRLNEHTGST